MAKIEFETELYGIDLHVLFEIWRIASTREGAMEAILEGYAECEKELGVAATTPGGDLFQWKMFSNDLTLFGLYAIMDDHA